MGRSSHIERYRPVGNQKSESTRMELTQHSRQSATPASDRSIGTTAPTIHVSPKVAVVVVSYNRAEYLTLMLRTLLRQNPDEQLEVVILDNGSRDPLERSIAPILGDFKGPVKLIREERNLLSPVRWEQAVSAASSDFVLLPGDDDLLAANYLSTMSRLVAQGPDVTMVSTGMGQIDARGRRLGGETIPPHYESTGVALASLITRDPYAMPASGFRKNAVDLSQAPRSRTAFDWWLWIQCWLSGRAAVSDDLTVLYRQHSGQEQRGYRAGEFLTDGARMLSSVLADARFQRLLEAWPQEEVQLFTSTLLNGVGPNSGDSRWGPLLQMEIADQLRPRISTVDLVALHSQACGHSGAVPTVGALRALAGGEVPDEVPQSTWTRVPVKARWTTNCPLSTTWRRYLNIPEGPGGLIRVLVGCSCGEVGKGGLGHRLGLAVTRTDSACGTTHLVLKDPPSDEASLEVREAISILARETQGFDPSVTLEQRLVVLYRRLRVHPTGAWAERAVRQTRRYSAKRRAK